MKPDDGKTTSEQMECIYSHKHNCNCYMKTDHLKDWDKVLSSQNEFDKAVENPKEKRKFETGAVRDNDIEKADLIESVSYLALHRFAKYMTGKSTRYGKGNWKKGIPPQAYLESMARHFQKFVSEWEYGVSEEHDDHLSAMAFNLFGLMHELELIKMGKGRFEISEEYKQLYHND